MTPLTRITISHDTISHLSLRTGGTSLNNLSHLVEMVFQLNKRIEEPHSLVFAMVASAATASVLALGILVTYYALTKPLPNTTRLAVAALCPIGTWLVLLSLGTHYNDEYRDPRRPHAFVSLVPLMDNCPAYLLLPLAAPIIPVWQTWGSTSYYRAEANKLMVEINDVKQRIVELFEDHKVPKATDSRVEKEIDALQEWCGYKHKEGGR